MLNDDIFINCVENKDVVVLTETWLQEKIEIKPDIFYNYHSIRQRSSLKGRPSGGLSVLVKKIAVS